MRCQEKHNNERQQQIRIQEPIRIEEEGEKEEIEENHPNIQFHNFFTPAATTGNEAL